MMNRTVYTKQSGVLRGSYGIIIVLNMINYYINTILLSSGKYESYYMTTNAGGLESMNLQNSVV